MNFVFRTDASLDIGTGHVIRCLTLADALRERGGRCHFVCREHAGHLGALIEQRGHAVTLLPLSAVTASLPDSEPGTDAAQPAHAAWLGRGIVQETDAQETLAAIGAKSDVDWLVVDHYALDSRWERLLRPACKRLMVIDDLADRLHDCDLLLNQNLGRTEDDYVGLLPAHAKKLVGPRYALLRPEFAQWREYSLGRRAEHPGLRHLLISMGGVDKDNVTGQVLDAIASSALPAGIRITVVMGQSAPWLEQVRSRAAAMPQSAEVLSGVSNMAQLMSDADLAIGAAGATSWERCCLGLPCLMLVLASNQQDSADALAAGGAALAIGSAKELPPVLLQLSESPASVCEVSLHSLSQAAQAVVDGEGITRLMTVMTANGRGQRPSVRRMQVHDLGMVRAWRNDPAVSQYMLTRHEISPQEHSDWFARVDKEPDRHLLIVEEEGQPLGFVQFSCTQRDATAVWGFYAAPGAPKGTGRKLGTAALDHAFLDLGLRNVRGQALSSNQASIAFHEALGFQREETRKRAHMMGDEWRDMVCFGLSASQWATLRKDEA